MDITTDTHIPIHNTHVYNIPKRSVLHKVNSKYDVILTLNMTKKKSVLFHKV